MGQVFACLHFPSRKKIPTRVVEGSSNRKQALIGDALRERIRKRRSPNRLICVK